MIEIRIHGRGGQGAVVASKVMASAFFKQGKWVQAFPSFGAERRGAPVAAYTRVDDREITLRCSVRNPNHLIVLDENLTRNPDITQGLKEGGWIVINSEKDPKEFRLSHQFHVATVDASWHCDPAPTGLKRVSHCEHGCPRCFCQGHGPIETFEGLGGNS